MTENQSPGHLRQLNDKTKAIIVLFQLKHDRCLLFTYSDGRRIVCSCGHSEWSGVIGDLSSGDDQDFLSIFLELIAIFRWGQHSFSLAGEDDFSHLFPNYKARRLQKTRNPSRDVKV